MTNTPNKIIIEIENIDFGLLKRQTSLIGRLANTCNLSAPAIGIEPTVTLTEEECLLLEGVWNLLHAILDKQDE